MCVGAGVLVGAGLSAVSALAAGSQRSAAAKANASFIERQAEIQRRANQFELSKARRQEKRIVGQQAAGFAKAGVAPDSGSVGNVITDTLTSTGLDQAAINFGAQATDQNLQSRAQIQRNRAQTSFTGGIVNAIAGVAGNPGVRTGFGNSTILRNPFSRAF